MFQKQNGTTEQQKKERIRSTYHQLPYRAIPKIMIRCLAMTSASTLNLFPVKGGVSKYYSPNVIMSQRNISYEKDCAYPYGAYVQASNDTDPTYTNAPRTVDAVYLRPALNVQGGHELMHLAMGNLIRRRKVTEIPETDLQLML